MDFINRVIAVFGDWRKGSVFNRFITLPGWFNACPAERIRSGGGCLHKRILAADI